VLRNRPEDVGDVADVGDVGDPTSLVVCTFKSATGCASTCSTSPLQRQSESYTCGATNRSAHGTRSEMSRFVDRLVVVGLADAELLGGHSRALDSIGDLLKGDVAGVVG